MVLIMHVGDIGKQNEWRGALDLSIIIMALILSLAFVGSININNFTTQALGSKQKHPELKVGNGNSLSPKDNTNNIQGAGSVTQSGSTGSNLQSNAGKNKDLQPSSGQSALPDR